VSSAARNPVIPNVPTTIEAGLPAFQAYPRHTFVAPKTTPKTIHHRLVGALDQAIDDEATRKRMLVLGSDIPVKARRGPEPLLALVKSEIERWTRIIETANVKAE
jgi:tripartite-type tricarboxylate transporter receptor subunit TctC